MRKVVINNVCILGKQHSRTQTLYRERIAPGKTLRFEINTVPVVVSLDRDEVYHVKFSGSRRCHYSFENLMFDLGLIFDAVTSSVA